MHLYCLLHYSSVPFRALFPVRSTAVLQFVHFLFLLHSFPLFLTTVCSTLLQCLFSTLSFHLVPLFFNFSTFLLSSHCLFHCSSSQFSSSIPLDCLSTYTTVLHIFLHCSSLLIPLFLFTAALNIKAILCTLPVQTLSVRYLFLFNLKQR